MSLNPVLQARMLVLRAREGWVLGRVLYVYRASQKEELSVREKSYWNQLQGLAYLILFVVIGCTQLRISPPVVTMRHDMDNIVNTNGMPRNITESFFGGTRHNVLLYYPDAVYGFQTDEAKSYTVLTSTQTISFGQSLPQSPLTLWFRTKYPNLNWKGVPVK